MRDRNCKFVTIRTIIHTKETDSTYKQGSNLVVKMLCGGGGGRPWQII